MARSAYALSFAVLLAIFEFGNCLRCYQCNSQSDPTCNDPFSGSRYLVDCNTQDSVNYNRNYLQSILPRELVEGVAGAPRYCHKIVMHSGTTIRTCLDANPNDLTQSCAFLSSRALAGLSSDRNNQIKSCTACDRDGCNSAGSLAVSLPLATFALIASYLFCKQ